MSAFDYFVPWSENRSPMGPGLALPTRAARGDQSGSEATDAALSAAEGEAPGDSKTPPSRSEP